MSNQPTLYVLNKGGKQYAVSKLPLVGYKEYTHENGCWISAKTNEKSSGGFKPKRSKTKSKKSRNN